ncbi:hypothetical protein CBOM_06356 [Ceraceosorus bombacis]|uniref:Uncharacterized protein n=1 Tax=Ceraceosorus bombacis TaxID=401625 RepID=A0A0P1A3X3_9BASI|nr:hypothetical protein CBOM_06356 [Ceraceosorus bombacis]
MATATASSYKHTKTALGDSPNSCSSLSQAVLHTRFLSGGSTSALPKKQAPFLRV